MPLDKSRFQRLSESVSRRLSRIQAKHIVFILFVLSLGISLQCLLISIDKEYTRYNNFLIFKYSFEHLLHHQNLYLSYATEHFDFYKYSPSFALAMSVFYWMPEWMGVFVYNFLSLAVFLAGIYRLRFEMNSLKYMLLFLFVEIGISLSSFQTNLLIAGCIMLAFSFLEEGRPGVAALLISCTVFIKLFGLVAFALFLLYPKRFRFMLYTVGWFALLGLLPLMVSSARELAWQYGNWWQLLKEDHSASVGLSFMGWMNSWFGLDLDKSRVVLIAALIFCLPLLKISQYKSHFFRLQILGSILLWVVIFNHKGESPTYIIAMMGVAIWYFTQRPGRLHLVMLWLCVIFTSFSSTDAITPLWVTARYVDPYSLKAVFCSLVWFKLIFDVMTNRSLPHASAFSPNNS